MSIALLSINCHVFYKIVFFVVGIAKIVLGTRLGNFTDKTPEPHIEDFIESVRIFISATPPLINKSEFMKKTLYRRQHKAFQNAAKTMFSISKNIIIFNRYVNGLFKSYIKSQKGRKKYILTFMTRKQFV